MSKAEIDAPLPTPRPSALTSLLDSDPDLSVTPEKAASTAAAAEASPRPLPSYRPASLPKQRLRKEVRFANADAQLVCSADVDDRRSRVVDAEVATLSPLEADESLATTVAVSHGGSSGRGRVVAPLGRRIGDARRGYSFPFTDPLDKENVPVAVASGAELAVPELNATLHIQKELEALRSRGLNIDGELRARLANSRAMREQLKSKVYAKLNAKEPVFGEDMIATDVPRDQLLASAERSLAAAAVKARGKLQMLGTRDAAADGGVGRSERGESEEDGGSGNRTLGLHRFWSQRARSFAGAAVPGLYQYRFRCLATLPEPSHAGAAKWQHQRVDLCDVYRHLRSWHL